MKWAKTESIVIYPNGREEQYELKDEKDGRIRAILRSTITFNLMRAQTLFSYTWCRVEDTGRTIRVTSRWGSLPDSIQNLIEAQQWVMAVMELE